MINGKVTMSMINSVRTTLIKTNEQVLFCCFFNFSYCLAASQLHALLPEKRNALLCDLIGLRGFLIYRCRCSISRSAFAMWRCRWILAKGSLPFSGPSSDDVTPASGNSPYMSSGASWCSLMPTNMGERLLHLPGTTFRLSDIHLLAVKWV